MEQNPAGLRVSRISDEEFFAEEGDADPCVGRETTPTEGEAHAADPHISPTHCGIKDGNVGGAADSASSQIPGSAPASPDAREEMIVTFPITAAPTVGTLAASTVGDPIPGKTRSQSLLRPQSAYAEFNHSRRQRTGRKLQFADEVRQQLVSTTFSDNLHYKSNSASGLVEVRSGRPCCILS